ncbi:MULTISPECIES: ArsR family transcriptional regulator [unclassified Paenibacillus]|uniref:ArsR/SmtB family transcription factor n=1 Tax=unclassified Paenibacillus TaxID=185978 RepID=UPI0024070EAF|nr:MULTISPECIES: ArsR family transcriptional regulator [unclassified Paenibacillus]MDF9843866.1 putative transcriptional regulator [Paenibacillus sp. PastF-2]MDF9850450.1 putative transcriptional regulator [Paenibacillus sp. PastM-2]MDF9857045.1 putative transcriptional regulator [Paenibacillus sp. PastF-1]MDH6482317.1 putative transcriptional regulator [Paenibacillus sp. PastH-2]MDH6509716.1 putative transcriptional regulator [Paenibacillus sp. PastM-3]
MLELSFDDPERLVTVTHALSTRSRVDILRLLNTRNLNIIEIADKLKLPVSTVASNIKVLEAAGLIHTELLPASRGAMKVCSRNYDDVHIALNAKKTTGGGAEYMYEMEMPVGHYSDCEVSPTCGMANSEGLIIKEDEPASFYHPKHVNAQLIWLRRGFLEYLMPMDLPAGAQIQSLELSMEMCSEAPNYDQDWPSNISVWVNGTEIGMWTSPGDFGDRRGRLNPNWWWDGSTQYGFLKSWRVDHEKTTLDMEKVSETTLKDLQLEGNPKLRLRIGIRPDAVHQGGLNLFGRQFGDYDQHIIMKVRYTLAQEDEVLA